MAITPKVLGQAYPSASTITDLYTVPNATSAAISSGCVCNQSGASDYFRISIAVGGAADTSSQYIYSGVTIPANETFIFTIGITLAAGDVVRVNAANGYCSFNLFGSEVS